jgi:hypothetical protein
MNFHAPSTQYENYSNNTKSNGRKDYAPPPAK